MQKDGIHQHLVWHLLITTVSWIPRALSFTSLYKIIPSLSRKTVHLHLQRHSSCSESLNTLSRDMTAARKDCYEIIFSFKTICNTEMSLSFSSSLTSFKYYSEVLLELNMLSLHFILLLGLSKLKCSENSKQKERRKTPTDSPPSCPPLL